MSSANTNAQIWPATEASNSSGAVPPQGTGTIMSKESGMPESQPALKPAPRLYHKKSRTGCQQCRARRVKVHPPFRSPTSSINLHILKSPPLPASLSVLESQKYHHQTRTLVLSLLSIYYIWSSIQVHQLTFRPPFKLSDMVQIYHSIPFPKTKERQLALFAIIDDGGLTAK